MDGMTPGEEIAEHAYKRWWTTPNRDAYTGSVMREVGRDAFEVGRRAGREDAARSTCQENPEPEHFGVFVDAHLHECSREAEHRSRVHRCACGAEWWSMEGPVRAGLCTCPDVDVSTFLEGPGRRTVKGRPDPKCPIHGKED